MSKYNLLLFTPHQGGRGGVLNFCELLSRNLSPYFHIERLFFGNRPNNKSFMKRILYFIHSVYTLMIKLSRYDHDVIHLNPSFGPTPLLRDSILLFIIYRYGYVSKTVVFFHGWHEWLGEIMIHNAIYRRAFVKLYKNVGAILVLHNGCRKQLIDMGIEPQKIRVTTAMYEGIDESEEALSRKTDDKINILFMAVFLPDKGQDIVAKVGRLLAENGRDDFHIAFAGDGPLMPELRKLVAENDLSEYVDILGYIRGKERERVLVEGDIFLFPTWRSEGFPAVIIEAMGAGQVVISTPRAAIPDIIDDGENGFICNSRDPEVFCQVVERLLDNPDLLHKMQKRAKEKAVENYEASGYMRRLEAVYLSVMKSDFIA